jgi:hypothetical protein
MRGAKTEGRFGMTLRAIAAGDRLAASRGDSRPPDARCRVSPGDGLDALTGAAGDRSNALGASP